MPKTLTASQFKKLHGKIPDLKFSEEKGWAYMGFFKLKGKVYEYNTYGPPGFITEMTTPLPKDVTL